MCQDFKSDLKKAKQRALHLLIRHGIRYGEGAAEKCQRMSERVESIAQQPVYLEKVKKLRAFKGEAAIIALSFIEKASELSRFLRAAQFMAFLDPVPCEHSSGEK